ncbi:LD-carboxypeptidase [Fictibacillus nanhaiensis]|uniref:S66 family peptidase n=1 Tax=Fictibacillus nanhaiensis TaxID=742169 RepID=UPI001C953276|nr:S66 peptidase family protein [Fictibacillus nanhaiensis]MBY6037759.1 LD-carboxypeptidase [Fictibacillus nanhaiensis]
MNKTVPERLQRGDEIRIIAPSTTHQIISEDIVREAIRNFEKLGLRVTFGKNIMESSVLMTAPIEKRIEDLHEAFLDSNVKGIFTTIGGFTSNQLLKYIDYDLIRKNPKVFCGYSDITALQNAIFTKTGLVTYSGPAFSSLGMKKGLDYTLEYLQKVLMSEEEADLKPSLHWSNDSWYIDQDNRAFIENEGYGVFQEGSASGTIIGGNLSTLNLLQGTAFMPSLENTILFLEDDSEVNARTFDRDLQSLIHQPSFSGVKGIVIGRFEKGSNITEEELRYVIETKEELRNLPVVVNANFGHTTPIFTFPIGGRCELKAQLNKVSIKLSFE